MEDVIFLHLIALLDVLFLHLIDDDDPEMIESPLKALCIRTTVVGEPFSVGVGLKIADQRFTLNH